jgi:alpha-beta hydrolase superfamily lysophospholipase
MEFLPTPDGLKLSLRHWPARGPSRGLVQIVHGLGEHLGRYAELAATLNAAGWDVAGHDQRGHGRSEGPRGGIAADHVLLTDLAAVKDHLHGHERHVLLGHSMGGVVAARFVAESLAPHAARWARDVDALVLSSPAFDPGLGSVRSAGLALLARLLPAVPLGNGLQPGWISRDPAVVERYVADPLVHRRITPRLARFIVRSGSFALRRAPRWRTPTLLLWAGADRCVAPAGSAAFAAAAPASVLTAQEYPALYHEIFNEPERDRVRDRLTDWLARI